MIDLIEKAIRYASSADEEYRCKLLSCSIYYSAAFSNYFIAYENGDSEMLAEMNEIYDVAYSRIVELGFNPEEIVSVDGGRCKVWPTLEEEAWKVWIGNRERHTGKSADELIAPPAWTLETEAVTT